LFLEAFNGVCRGMAVANSLQGSLDFHQNCRKRQTGAVFSQLRHGRNRLRIPAFIPHIWTLWRLKMGRGLLLWMIGIPLPIFLVIWLFGGLS
jgi:hypothetical protein